MEIEEMTGAEEVQGNEGMCEGVDIMMVHAFYLVAIEGRNRI